LGVSSSLGFCGGAGKAKGTSGARRVKGGLGPINAGTLGGAYGGCIAYGIRASGGA